jgi:hypothetical protein
VPLIFSSKRIVPIGRSMPKFVPIPSSPMRRAPSSVARARCRYSSPVVGAGADHLAVAQLELDAVHLDARRARRDGEPHAARGARLDRAREDLARRHVAPAVRVDPGAAAHVERDVGAVGLDPDRLRAADAGDERVLEAAQLAPGRLGSAGTVEEERARDEVLELAERHPGLLGQGGRRPQRGAPALLHRGLRDGLAGPAGAGQALGIQAGERADVLGRLDADARLRLARLVERHGAKSSSCQSRACS